MNRDFHRSETYVLHRVNAALTRLIQAESDGEITRANKWVRAWFKHRHALLASNRPLDNKSDPAGQAGSIAT